MEQVSNSVTPSSSLPAVVRRERGNLLIECVPEEVPPHLSQRLEQYQNTRSCSLEDFHLASASPSIQGLLVTTRFGETTQVHYVQQPGGYRKQLTFFQEPVAGAAACPNAQAEHRDCFLFARDVGGTEQYQNYCFDMSTGEYVMLSDGTSKNGFPIWSNKGDRCAYYSTRRNGKDWDIYISPLPSLSSSFASTAVEPEMVLSEGGSWYPVDWSPDDSCLLVKKYISANESQLWTLDLQTKQLQRIPPLSSSKEEEEKIAYGSTCFGKWMAGEDGIRSAGIFLTTDEGSEFKQLWFYDLENKRFTSQESLTKDIEWDVNVVRFCPFTHTKLAFTTNEGGIFQVYILDLVSGRRKRAGGLPIGILGSLRFHPDGKHLGVTINTSQTPSDVFLISLPESFDDEEPVYYPSVERWTFSEVGGLNTDTFVMPSLIHYPTFDEIEKDGGQQKERRKIPAFYYKPPASKKDGTTSSRYPVMIIIHGGPESQSLPSFTAKIQYFCLEMGIAVLVPNVRGSSGYGKTYLLLDNWYKREDSVKDIGSLIDWIAEQQELDENRILVNGGSYGGYMVLASMIHYSDKLRAGVERVGISNFVTFLEKTSDYRRDNRREEYGDERIPEMREFLLRISPLTNAHLIDKPMLIAQGLNDPRVPVYESEQVVAAIRQNGVPVWYLLAKDEGHGFHKKANVDYYLTAEAMFVRQHLL